MIKLLSLFTRAELIAIIKSKPLLLGRRNRTGHRVLEHSSVELAEVKSPMQDFISPSDIREDDNIKNDLNSDSSCSRPTGKVSDSLIEFL